MMMRSVTVRLSPLVVAIVTLAACGGAAAPGSAAASAAAKPSAAASASAVASAKPAPASSASAAAKLSGSADKVTFAYTSVSPASATWWVVKESGSWAKYGFDVTLQFIDTGNLLTQALIGGSLDIAGDSGVDVLTAAGAGNKDLVMLSLNTTTLTDILIVTPDINQASDLKGKKVGISKIGSEGDFTMIQALKGLGLDPDKDVTRLQIGTEGPRLAALKAGTISAGAQDISATPQIKQLGLKVMASLVDMKLLYAKQGVTLKRSYLQSHQDLVTRFMKGYLEGIAFYKDPKNRDKSLQYINMYMKTDPEVVANVYDSYSKLQAAKPYPQKDAFEKTKEFTAETVPALKNLDVTTVYDDSMLRQLDSSGFIDALYK
jgi:ABC-type nitrate/sulfonate/bicarbonate transport system substrate-binding protein